MKATILISAMLLMFSSAVYADDINEERAMQIAAQFVNNSNKARGWNEAPKELQIAYTSTQNSSAPELYIINKGQNEGFIIVAGDDRASAQVLGWSDNGSFDYESANPGLKQMLRNYADGIEHVRMTGTSGQKPAMSRTRTDIKTSVAPLIKTRWNQKPPFMRQCPKDGGKLSFNGCAAVAMAQIMRYWEWPKGHGYGKGYNYREYVDPSLIQNIAGPYANDMFAFEQFYDYSQSVYNWNNMLDDYNGAYEDEQADEVSKLMAELGCSLEMEYHTVFPGSPAHVNMDIPLVTFFGYSQDIKLILTNDPEELLNIAWQELSAGRPFALSLMVEIDGEEIGHEVVCDGYNADGYVHLNYGWGGNSDGFYLPSSLWGESQPVWNVVYNIHPSENKRVLIDRVYYELIGDEASVVGCYDNKPESDECELTIPATITADGKTYPVTTIWKDAFWESKVSSISISGVNKIPENLFAGKGNTSFYPLKSLTLGDGVKVIGEGAFKSSAISSLSIGKDLEEIGNQAFFYCQKLTYVPTLPATIKYIGKEAFKLCSNMWGNIMFDSKAIDFVIDEEAIPCGVSFNCLERAKEIRDNGVSGMACEYTVSTKTIYGKHAVSGTEDFTIKLPADLETFDVNSVVGCKEYIVDESNRNYSSNAGILFNKDKTELICYPSFAGNTFNIPAFIKRIGTDANLPLNYTLPPGINEIPATQLGLHNITVLSSTPPTITNLDGSIYAPGYEYNADYFTLTVPYGCAEAYKNAEGWNQYRNIVETDVLIGDKYCYQINDGWNNATVIARNAGADFNGIVDDIPATVTFKDKTYDVTEVSEKAFCGDITLKSITLGGNISTLQNGHDAFNGCSNLETINIGKQFEDMGQQSMYVTFFKECPNLAEINVEEGNENFFSEYGILYCNRYWGSSVELFKCPPMQRTDRKIVPREKAVISTKCQVINDYAFSGDFQKVTIPASVETIRDNAFTDCTQLKTVTCLSPNPLNVSMDVFRGIHTIVGSFSEGTRRDLYTATLRVPNNSKVAYEEAFIWKDFQKIECFNDPDKEYEVDIKALDGGDTTGDDPSNDPDVQMANAVVLHRTNGQKEYFVFSQRPIVTYKGDCLRLTCNNRSVQYSLVGLSKITFSTISTLGDVDGNGIINRLDAYAISSIIMRGGYDKAADLNNDDVVNVADIVTLMSIISKK